MYDANFAGNPAPDTDEVNWPLVTQLTREDGSILKINCPARGLIISNGTVMTDPSYITAIACNTEVKNRPVKQAAAFHPGPNGEYYPWDKRTMGMAADPGDVKYDPAIDGPGWQEVPGQPGVWIHVEVASFQETSLANDALILAKLDQVLLALKPPVTH